MKNEGNRGVGIEKHFTDSEKNFFFFNLEEKTGKNNFKIIDTREEITEDVQFAIAYLKNKRSFKKKGKKNG